MLIKFENTLLDTVPGTPMYLLVYDTQNPERMFFSRVRFKGLTCHESESRWGKENYSKRNFFILDFEYDSVSGTGKKIVKEIKVKWMYWPRHYQTDMRKGKNSFHIKAETLSVTKTPVPCEYVYISNDINKVKELVANGDFVRKGLANLNKEKEMISYWVNINSMQMINNF